MPEHVHEWQGSMHVDGCHGYTNTYVCECGAATTISGERQMLNRGRPTESLMMSDDDCERCRALGRGARRIPTRRYYRGPGASKWVRVKLHA